MTHTQRVGGAYVAFETEADATSLISVERKDQDGYYPEVYTVTWAEWPARVVWTLTRADAETLATRSLLLGDGVRDPVSLRLPYRDARALQRGLAALAPCAQTA